MMQGTGALLTTVRKKKIVAAIERCKMSLFPNLDADGNGEKRANGRNCDVRLVSRMGPKLE
jgi:hypothetical protein